MSLRTRFALAFALVSAIVAGLVGVLSYHAAATRITASNDTTLQAAETSLAAGETGILATPSGPGGGQRPDGDRGDGAGADIRRGQPIVGRPTGCSTASTAPTRPGDGPARDSAWRSCATWPSPTAGPRSS